MYLPLNPSLVGCEIPIVFWVGWLPTNCTALPRLEYPGIQVLVQLFSPPNTNTRYVSFVYTISFIENDPKLELT